MADFKVQIKVIAQDMASKALGGISRNLQGVGLAAAAGLGGVAAMGAGAAAGMVKLAADAAPVAGLKGAFEGLAESSGQSGDALMDALKRGSAGMVAQRDLMETYNTAAGLVSKQFANQLPDAMGMLSKVAASTGQDMGFMIDSLVKGVGRLSGPILDNLNVQVQLSEATERAAQMYGVEASALTKAQQQAGMMSVVMEKLAANTEAMPEVAGSAAAGLAGLEASMQDVKDRAGMTLLPMLGSLLSIAPMLLTALEPAFTFLEATVAPVLETVAGALAGFVGNLTEGMAPIAAFEELIAQFLPAEVVAQVMGFVGWVEKLVATVQPWVEQAGAWIAQTVNLQDVLIALGIALAAVVIPAVVSLVTSMAPILLTAAAIMAAVVLLRKAWESNFLGIQDITAKAMEAVRKVIDNVLSAIAAFWREHGATIMRIGRAMWQAIQRIIDAALGVIKSVVAAFQAAFAGDWYAFGENLRAAWDQVWQALKTIVSTAWDAIKGLVSNAIRSIVDTFRNTDWRAVGSGIIQGIGDGIAAGVDWLTDMVQEIAQNLLDAIKGFFGIKSPSKVFMVVGRAIGQGMALGIEAESGGVLGALDGMARRVVARGPTLAGALAGPGRSRAAGAGVTIINNFGPGSVRSDADIYRLANAIERSLILRGVRPALR